MSTIDESLCAPMYSEGGTAAALNEFAISLLSGTHVNLSVARHFRIPATSTFLVVAAGFAVGPDAVVADREAMVPEARLNDIRRRLAADTGRKMIANLEFNPRAERPSTYPATHWRSATGMQSHTQERGPLAEIDERAAPFRFGFAMQKFLHAGAKPPIGSGAAYLTSFRDSSGAHLDGSKQYVLRVPPKAPILAYWSASAYDAEDFHFVTTDTRRPSISSAVAGRLRSPSSRPLPASESMNFWIWPATCASATRCSVAAAPRSSAWRHSARISVGETDCQSWVSPFSHKKDQRLYRVEILRAQRQSACTSQERTGRIEVPTVSADLLRVARRVQNRYLALRLDRTDATNVSLTGYETVAVLTLDRRDFRAISPLTGDAAFRLLPDDL